MKNKKILKFRLLTLSIILFSFSPLFLSKIGFEYISLSVFYSIFFVYTLIITVFSHFYIYGDYLLENSKKDLLKHIKFNGRLCWTPYLLLYLVVVISLGFVGVLYYSSEHEFFIGIAINKELLTIFSSFGLISLFFIQNNRIGKVAAYLMCRYY